MIERVNRNRMVGLRF